MKNTIRFARRSISRALCVLALAAAAPAAAIPDVVSWAARVENDAGAFDGTMTVTFELFDATTGGTALWTELVSSAVVVNGDLVHELGSVEPLDDSLIVRDNLFLQVTLNGDVLAPRTALRAVPYALRATEAGHADEASHAADATTLAGLSAASFQFTAGAGGGLRLTGTAFSINAAGVVTTMLADGAVTTAKVADAAVTTGKLAANAVTATQLANGAVTTAKIAAGAVTTSQLASNAVTTATIAAGAVNADRLAAGSVTTAKIASNAVGTAQIAAGGVTGTDIAADAITETHINGGTNNVYRQPAGCGGDLQTTSANCKTDACSVFLGGIRFYECDGSCVDADAPESCRVTLFGSIFDEDF